LQSNIYQVDLKSEIPEKKIAPVEENIETVEKVPEQTVDTLVQDMVSNATQFINSLPEI
jgi:hypothetical protein